MRKSVELSPEIPYASRLLSSVVRATPESVERVCERAGTPDWMVSVAGYYFDCW